MDIENQIRKEEQIWRTPCERNGYLQVSVAFRKLMGFRVISLLPWLRNAQSTTEIGLFVIICRVKSSQESFTVWLLSLPLPTSALFFSLFFFWSLNLVLCKKFHEKGWVFLLDFDLCKKKFGSGIKYEITKQ